MNPHQRETRIASYGDYFRVEIGTVIHDQLSDLKIVCNHFGEELGHNENLCIVVREYAFMRVYFIEAMIHVECFCASYPGKNMSIGPYIKKGYAMNFFEAVENARMSPPILARIVLNILNTPL
jgi:hypothetical protein